MNDYGVIKICVFIVTFMGFISLTKTVLSNKEARLLNHKIEMIKTGFDSKLLTAFMDIEDLKTKGTCTCMESNLTVTEHIEGESDQKKTNKLDGSKTPAIRQDDSDRYARSFEREKMARKRFEIKTERLIQEKSKNHQDQINQLKTNIDVEVNNTLGLQRDKLIQLTNFDVEMNNTLGLQRETLNQLTNIDIEMNNTLGLQRETLNQLTNFDVEMNNTLGIQREKANKVSEVIKEMDKTITEQRGEIDRLNELVNDMSNTIERMKTSVAGCTEPASIIYGTVKYFGTSQGSIVRYTCEDGYSMTGDNKRKCLSTGQWDVDVPSCIQVTCPKLTLRLGTITYDKLTMGGTATFSCDQDYVMEGVNQVQCLTTGIWTGDTPICVPVTCPKLTLESGTVTYDKLTVGGTATFSCDKDYTMEGVNKVQCLPTGRWDGETQTCVPAYGQPLAAAMYKGARVMRGRDWDWGDQDGHGPGTVIGQGAAGAGFILVKWDNDHSNHYRRGYKNSYDIKFVPAYGQPLAAAMYKGARVMRGRDWDWGDQDGHGPGTVIGQGAAGAGFILVKWDNDHSNHYRRGYKNSYDIKFVPGTYDSSKAGEF